MTVIKKFPISRTILDFSSEHHSKNKIRKALRALEFREIEYSVKGEKHFIYNKIKVGIYEILIMSIYPQEGILKLKDLSILMINIYEVNEKTHINLARDGRFKYQYWVQENDNGNIKIKHLVDIVNHCQRLDGLKAFL